MFAKPVVKKSEEGEYELYTYSIEHTAQVRAKKYHYTLANWKRVEPDETLIPMVRALPNKRED